MKVVHKFLKLWLEKGPLIPLLIQLIHAPKMNRVSKLKDVSSHSISATFSQI